MADKKVLVNLESLDLTKVLVAVFVVIITLVLFILYKRRKSSRTGILLTGLCDSGKTLIYSQLIHKKHIQTHTSIKENISTLIINKDVLKIIDIPGHERLRNKFFEQYKSMAKAIVFVVDSLTLQQDIRDAAEYLHSILTDSVIVKNAPKVLILCNKQDQSLAKGSNAVKSIFEKELDTLRSTKSKQLNPEVQKQIGMLGDWTLPGDFSFSSLYLKVDFAESFAFNKNKTTNFEQFSNWLATI